MEGKMSKDFEAMDQRENVFKTLWERAVKLPKHIEGFRKYLYTSDGTNPKSSNL